MSNQVYFEYFCKDSILWDYNLTWNTTRPKLTRCLNQTLLNWIPSSLLWIYFFLELTRKQKPLKKSITWNFLNRIRLIVSVFCTLINIIQILNLTNQYVNFGNSPLPADFLAPLIDIGSFTLVTLSLYYHRLRGILTINSNIWIFLFLKTVTVFLTNYSTWTNWNKEYSHFEATLFSIYFAVICLLLILCSFSDQTNDKKENLKRILSPELEASFPNRLAFWWFNEMAILGWKRNLTTADLWQLNEELRTENLFPSFEEKLNQQWSKSKGKKVNIVPILVKLYGRYFLIGSCFKLIYDVCQFITPQLLKYLLNFIEDGLEKPIWHGFFIAFSMFVVTTLQGLFLNYYSYRMYIVGMKTNSVLTAAIYKKSLDLSDQSRKEVSSGEIINLMAVDSKRFLDLLPYLSLIWSAPFQIIVSIYFLYLELGYSAFFGLAVMILMLPLNALIAHWNRGLQIKLMNQKDERVKFMNEILAGIKILKFYAWEESFINRITSLRKKELEHLKQISYLNSIVKFISNCAPMMVSVTTFAVYVLLQKETLTAQKAFVSLSLFNILKFPLTMLPILISYNVMASVSVKRINSFLSNPDLEQYVTRNSESDAIVIENGSFGWGKKKEGFSFESSEEGLKTKKRKSFFQRSCKIGGETNNNENGGLNPVNEEPTLVDINLRIAQGSFVAIVGSVGSGKSSLINAILGEMKRIKGRVNVSEKLSIAYVAQEAWIQNSSLRDNILFGQPYDKNRYNKVISACALRPDISYLPGGDKTEIGEKGINLSGGQKQRVSLARACYSGSDLYIFDDPLSAVDAHVSKHIFDKVLSSKSGLLRNKTRVLVTNKLDLLSKVDKIIVLKNGKISEAGTYKELMNSGRDFADLVNHYTIQNIEKDDFEESLRDSYNRSRSESLRKDRAASLLENKLIESETSETGKVKWSVYGEYFKMVSFVWANIIVFGFLISSGFSLASNVWLSKWSEDSQSQTELSFNTTESFNDLPTESTQDSQAQTKMRLGVYSLLGLLQCFFNLFGSLALVIGTLRASFEFHRDLLHRIFRCSMAFFDTTPAGRIVNRFSKDIDTIDVLIPDSLSSWLLCFFQVLATFVIISIQTPMFLTVLFPILVLYGFIQRIYVASSRQLKRLESVTRSPIYSHFSETLNGVNTIKAFNVCQRFKHESAEKVDFNISCYYPTVIANRWLALRLDFCGNLITLFAAVFAILTRGTLSSGDVGLSVSYALSITLMFNWFVRMSSELETNIVAVERILEYCCIPSEADLYNAKLNPRETWPEDGSIKFEAYSARYRPGTELVLKSISVDIKPKEKIGIVGRTGAGKSTVTLSLFRIIEPASGSIYIDDYNISDLPLHPLRSRLAIIPQDPVLFSGTLRFNLDPFNRYTDKEIWNSLAHAHLKNFILDLNQGLEYSISEEGKNLSVGQRQLLCLARALLKRPKILFLDEATAAIDLETDSLIQTTIRSEFKDCTILTIAHRLNTIMDSDRVLVLDKGKIAEFDSPNALLAQKDTIFYSLAKEANLVT